MWICKEDELENTHLSKSLLHSILQSYPANYRQCLSQGHNKIKSLISNAQISKLM